MFEVTFYKTSHSTFKCYSKVTLGRVTFIFRQVTFTVTFGSYNVRQISPDTGIGAVVRDKERIDLLKPEEQAFGQRDAKVEVYRGPSDMISLLFLARKSISDWCSRIPLFSHWWNRCVDEF